MCLETSQLKPAIARNDIICFKQLRNDNMSPCYPRLYEESKEYSSGFSTSPTFWNSNIITVNIALHSFKYAIKCINDSTWITQEGSIPRKLVVSSRTAICVIPKGSLYYSDETCFASNKLKVIKIIENDIIHNIYDSDFDNTNLRFVDECEKFNDTVIKKLQICV